MTILTIDHLTKRQGNTLLLPEINLHITAGQCIVIQSNNEQGHLFIQLLLGTVPASSGQVQFEETDLHRELKKNVHKIGVSLLNDGFYERLKVRDYLCFYRDLYESKSSIQNILSKIGLIDKQNSVVSTLTFSEKKRLQLGRTIIHNPSFLIWEEPEQNVDMESLIIIRSLIASLITEGKAILITTSHLADAISIASEVYRLNQHDFKKMDIIDEPDDVTASENHPAASDSAENRLSQTEQQEEQPGAEVSVLEAEADIPEAEAAPIVTTPVRVEKIPAKVEDKIILFDPTEINFIESSDGVSMLNVKGETFPCTFTLNDLELKLKAFGFFRCHRSYIVNLQKVREVITWTRNSFSLILDDEKRSSIPLSKGKFDELKAILGI